MKPDDPLSPALPGTEGYRSGGAPITWLLGLCCVTVWLLAELFGSTSKTDTLLRFGAVWRDSVWKGEWWRLFTSMFLHIGLAHLLWNLGAGFAWAADLERRIGTRRFLLVYLVSGLAGSAASVIGYDGVEAGAAGALFGVIGGRMALRCRLTGDVTALWADHRARRELGAVAVWLAVGLFVGFETFAQVGGMLAGFAIAWTLFPLRQRALGLVLTGVGLLLVLSLRPLPGLHDRLNVLTSSQAQ